jgi:2,3-bisphosphoglycerate-dependent phosphoglycerate mutase
MRIIIVRHGETALNAAKVLQSHDTPLSERGHEQARLAGDALGARSSSIAKILTSDMMRTKQTAQHIRDALAYGSQVQLVESPLLRERDFGDLQGLSWQQAMAIHGEGLFSVRVACLSAPPPARSPAPRTRTSSRQTASR